MVKGKVKWFDAKKGYGFIAIDGGKDAFVHHSQIQGTGYKSLEEGQDVELDVDEDVKGLRAKNVVKL